ncbi:MAG: TerC family protein [Steroidobacteraceae bacterium]|jgi:predicted tellurium resistance membrane protein TerC
MELLHEPQAWISFATLVVLEIVLGIDNILFLTVLVGRLPGAERASARILGLLFAMLTRIALLFSITWLATFTTPLAQLWGYPVSVRALILSAGGLFLVVKSMLEIRGMLHSARTERKPGMLGAYWLVIAQIGVLDVVFSLDSVFTAVGLASRIEVMVAAIVAAVLIMIWVAGLVSDFLLRYPTVKVLALGFLLLIGLELISEALNLDLPKGYLYFALAFALGVEWINILVSRRESR